MKCAKCNRDLHTKGIVNGKKVVKTIGHYVYDDKTYCAKCWWEKTHKGII